MTLGETRILTALPAAFFTDTHHIQGRDKYRVNGRDQSDIEIFRCRSRTLHISIQIMTNLT